MNAYELIQVLARFPADQEVTVSQKPAGYVVPIRWYEFEDGVIKLYGDGSLKADDGEPVKRRR